MTDPQYDLTKLDAAELELLERLLSKAAGEIVGDVAVPFQIELVRSFYPEENALTNTNHPLPEGEKIKAMLARLSSMQPTVQQLQAFLKTLPSKSSGAQNNDRK